MLFENIKEYSIERQNKRGKNWKWYDSYK